MSTAGLYRLLADAVLVIHFGFVSFVVGGLVLIWAGWALRWRWVGNFWFRLAHLLAMGVVLAEALGGVICPLTIWEDKLRWMAGEGQRYQGTFIQHWLHRVMFYSVSNVAITVAYAVFFTLLGASLWLVKPRWPWARKARPSPRQHGPGAGNQDDPAG
jgi:hypothetical protein